MSLHDPCSHPSFRARSARVGPGAALLAPVLLLCGGTAHGAASSPCQDSRREVVAALETRLPAASEFLLRGTLPVPPGTRVGGARDQTLTLLDWDGTPRFTQVENVSRYAAEGDGADVLELLAIVHRDPSLAPGAPARYLVVRSGLLVPVPPADFEPVPDVVNELILDPEGIEIASYDCFGNKYTCHPLERPQEFKVLHRGPLHAETRTYQEMLPERYVKDSTLPHFFGVHTYLHWFSERTSVGLDVRFHNAHDGHDQTTPLDDPLDKLYFQRLELSLPEGWTVQQDFPDPLFGDERVEGGRRIVELVGPNPDGKLHVIRWEGQFHRRLMLSPANPTAMARARALLDGAGRAFCVRGFADDGREYWSWWNAATARYFPQRFQLPLLDHIGRAALDAELAGKLDFIAAHLASGTGVGDYPLAVGRLGWGHPYGVSYGGMTSGLEIYCYDGITTAAAASQDGYQLYTALHRMQTDRQPNALYQRGGEPSSVEEWLIEDGDRDYVPFEHFVVPLISGSHPDPFGIRSAPQFQIDFVQANGLAPAYEAQHLHFDPHDHQHFVRYTRSAKVLAWLGNDSLAIDDLRHQAENFNFTYHQFRNGPYGAAQSTGLLSKVQFVQSHPGTGFPYGRGEAWGLDCVLAAYSTADPAWRARKLPWLELQTEVLSAGQAACSGFIQAFVSDKAVDGKYRARQVIEQSITENALVGLHESVFANADPAHSAMVRDVLRDSLYAFIGEMSWFPGQWGPWRYTGVGPLDLNQAPWCSLAEMPSDSWTPGDIEAFQDWSSFGYGFELTGDHEFIRRARTQIGAADFQELVERLRSAGTSNLENRAALLTVVQHLDGEL